jgi:hypothetical protein
MNTNTFERLVDIVGVGSGKAGPMATVKATLAKPDPSA